MIIAITTHGENESILMIHLINWIIALLITHIAVSIIFTILIIIGYKEKNNYSYDVSIASNQDMEFKMSKIDIIK